MSVAYGGPTGGYAPPGRVNFGWIGESFELFKTSAGVWILAILLYGIVNNVVNGIISTVFHNPGYVTPPGPFGGISAHWGIQYGPNSNVTPLGEVVAALFTWAYSSFQSASLYRMAVKQVRGEVVSFSDAFSGGPYFGNMLILSLLLFILSFAGIFALCVGIFVVAAFSLPAQALVADGRSATEAISQSIAGMKQDWLNGALLVLVFSLLIIASCVPCLLGLFVTIPMVHIVGALAYRDMIGMPGIGAPASPFGQPQTPGFTPGVWPPPPGQTPSFGQPPNQQPPFGQPPASPPRRSLGGDDLEDNGNPPTQPGGPPRP